MKKPYYIGAFAALVGISTLTFGAENETAPDKNSNQWEKGAPLPLHTIEGSGGVLITPRAYLTNPGDPAKDYSLPSLSATYVNARQKSVTSLSVSETLFQRVELGFGASRFDTGSLRSDVLTYAGANTGTDDVWLFNLNARFLALKEGEFNLPLPAITVGVHGKYNDGIGGINRNLGGLLDTIGYRRDYGVDFTVTATKSFSIYGHPLILTVGGRASQGAQLGYLGFGGSYKFTVEGSVVFGVTDWLFVAAEYRQKPDPYSRVSAGGKTLIGGEDDWWTVGAAFLLDKHTTLTVGYGHFGRLLNTKENTAWAVSLKYEF